MLEGLLLLHFRQVKCFEYKKCFFCGSKHVKKNGRKNSRQQYKCNDCCRQFIQGNKLNPDELWQLYSAGKQSAQQLAERFGCSRKTILRHLNKAGCRAQFAAPKTANVILDTTYFGRHFGVMVLYDAISKQALSVTEVKAETNALYHQAAQELRDKGILIQSIICDGKAGLLQSFSDLPVQLCQFHQVKTVNRYLTNSPKTEAGKALREIALLIKGSSRTGFEKLLADWLEVHQTYLNERTVNPETGKTFYTHKRLRSAYFSLKRNMDWLFAFECYPELSIPKTTNLLEGCFGDMKRLLRCHSGMKKENKIRFIKDYFSIK